MNKDAGEMIDSIWPDKVKIDHEALDDWMNDPEVFEINLGPFYPVPTDKKVVKSQSIKRNQGISNASVAKGVNPELINAMYAHADIDRVEQEGYNSLLLIIQSLGMALRGVAILVRGYNVFLIFSTFR